MKLTATLYTGHHSAAIKGQYQFVYRRRIYDNGIELVDSIEIIHLTYEAVGFAFNYKSDDIIENMNRDTHIIEEEVWQEYCDKLAKYLTENDIMKQ